MTVPQQPTRTTHVGNGVTTVFAYDFLCLAKRDMQVLVAGVVIDPSGYTVSNLGQNSGGDVTFQTPPANLAEIVIQLDVVLDRLTDYQTNGDLFAKTVNLDFDRLWLALQNAFDWIGRAVQLPLEFPPRSNTLPLAAVRARKALIFDASGNVTVGTDDYEDQAAEAAASAAAAAASAAQASAAATEAQRIADEFGDLESAVDRAETAATSAAEDAASAAIDADRAEVAASAATLNAGIFPNTAAGLAATVEGGYFSVPATGANEYLILYRKVSGAAVEQKRYPSVRGMETLNALVAACAWLEPSALISDGTVSTNWFPVNGEQRVEAALAIKSAWVENGVANEHYAIGLFFVNDPTNLDRISLFAVSTGTVVATTGAVTITKNPNGLTRVVVGDTANPSTVRAILDIDYREITSTGNLVSGARGPLRIARANIFSVLQRYHDNEALPAWIKQEYRATVLDGNDRWREAAFAIRGIQLNNISAGEIYRVVVLTKDDPGAGTRITIGASTGNVCFAQVPTPTGVGLQRVVLSSMAGSGVTGVAHINFGNVSGPFVMTDPASNLVIDTAAPNIFEEALTSPMRLDALEWPAWLSRLSTPSYTHLNIAKVIKAVDLKGTLPGAQYGVSVLTKQDPTFGDRIFIRSGGVNVAIWQPSSTYVPSPDGVDRLPLVENAGSGVSGEVIVDWAALPTGVLVSTSSPTLIIDPAVWSSRGAKTAIEDLETLIGLNGGGAVRPLARAVRLAVGISSIPWGTGYLGQNTWVGLIEDFMRTRLATTIHADVIAPDAVAISQPNMWQGSVRRVSGAGAEVEFDSWGDELTVNFCRERGNAGAALMDLYVDGTLFDTFSTYNAEPFGTATENFTGNGVDLKYPLSRAFTYGHAVTVSGASLVGGMNTQASGATIPVGWDYMITRAYSVPLNAVVHQIWFRNAPSGAIVCNYSYGESITHMRGTLGNVGQGLSTALESAFADGSVSEDTTQPASVSSGVGFRESDPRACKTFILGEAKQRHFRLVVRALDPRATGPTPWLDLNFVTNRMHHIMNAGIGGWTVDFLLTSDILLNRVDRIAEWRPDMVLMESCTNDDWATHVSKGWVTRTGVTAQQLKDDESSNYYNAISGASPNKTVQDNRIPIAAITATSVTLDMTNATVSAAPGDALIIGSFHGDHRRVTTRLIDTYSAGVVTFKRPISADDFAQADTLTDLVGDWVMIKAAPAWVTGLEQCVDVITGQNPDCRVHIATAGQPNFNHRRLFGYREIGQALARQHGWGFVDLYDATGRFTYNQPQDARVYITNSQGVTATGATSYPLYLPNGAVPTAFMLRNPRIVVDGVDRTNMGVHIEGGYSYSWPSGIAEPSLSNRSFLTKPYRLVFTNDVPPAGATIEIYINTLTWSTDDTHPGRITYAAGGIPTFGVIAQQVVDALTIGIL